MSLHDKDPYPVEEKDSAEFPGVVCLLLGAILIQKYIRGYLARKHYRQQSHHIVICQAAIRRFLARRQYKKLKIEARSIEHVKKLNKGLENKIISLQHHHQNEAIELRNILTTFKALEIEIKNLNNLLIEKNKKISKLEEDVKIERDEKMDLVHEHEKYRMATGMQLELSSDEMSKLRKELDNVNEILLSNQKGAEENLKVRLEEEKNLLLNEYDNDRQAYQKLLQEYHCLEQHCETLEKQMSSQHRSNTHIRNISDVSSISTVDESLLAPSDMPEDYGYGSVRSTASAGSNGRGKLENIDWTEEEEENAVARNRLPSVRKKEKDYLGMFSYKNGDENAIMKRLVIDLKPRTAVTLLPGLPAYILFMCIRHSDYVNDEDKVRILLSAFSNSVKKVIKKRREDFETNVLWLSNTLRLVHTMKQYSGDKAFQSKNTPKQNEQSLRNFDLPEYRQVLTDIAIWINTNIVEYMEEKVQPLIVPAILEHEKMPGIGGSTMGGFRGRTSSLRDLDSPGAKQKPTDTLLQELTSHYKILTLYGVDPEVISQIFKQVFYFLCASSLNNLLLRKELCHWSKGFHIRYNVSHFEMWTREKQLDEQAIQSTLQPIIQAAQLLQARKTDDDVASVCEMCSVLTPLQICKILNIYTPVDELEQRVPVSFIRKVQAKLQERPNRQEQQALLMDIEYSFPIRFPFNPSVICVEDIDIPDVLKLPMLEKV